jgi:hypothetical protein
MQGQKKGGAGSKGVWGKIGDEYKKSIPQSDLDDEDLEVIAQEKFKQQVKAKLASDKFNADELEPYTRQYTYPPMKPLFALHKPALISYLKERETISVKYRPLLTEIYQESNL